jgi:hypothetical protein
MRIDHLLDEPFLDGRFPLPLDHPFTARTARLEGVSRHNLRRLLDSGHLHQPVTGTYLATQAGDSIRLRAESLGLVVPPDCVVCDRHAGWLHGAEMVLAPNEHLALRAVSIFRPSGHGRLRNKLSDSGERNLIPEDVEVVDGIQVTTRLRTAWDLGRQRFREPALAGMDQMLRLGGFEQDEFLGGVERFRGMRWVTRLRELAPLADGRAESPGESVLRLRWLDSGLPWPTPQLELWVDGILVARFDLGLEELLLAAEYLGLEWHSSDEQVASDDRRREHAEGQGWWMEDFDKHDLFSRKRSVEEVLRAAAKECRARRRLVIDLSSRR